MGMFGPTNEELIELRNEIYQLRNSIDNELKIIRLDLERDVTFSEAEARVAAEKASQLEEGARESSKKISEALFEIEGYRKKTIGKHRRPRCKASRN